MYDVVIAGWGPTGMIAACLLSRAGHRVGVFERHAGIYPLPRVGGVHDDVLRIFQEIGIVQDVFPAGYPIMTYDMVHDGQPIFTSPFSPLAAHGWPQLLSLFQPYFEKQLDSAARSHGAEIHQGQRIVGVSQTHDYAEIELEDVATGERSMARGRYLIASDGGNSFIRQALEIDSENFGFDQDWLVVDGELKRARKSWPEMRQLCNPDQPGMLMQMGKYHRRWAFMVLDGERLEDATKPEAVWRRLDRPEGANPEELRLIRHAGYRFKARLALEWRKGRIFLAGDSAHEMPPYLGQGMCSGIRDAQNLALKLDLVLNGKAPDGFLDQYASERIDNCRTAIVESVRVGRAVIERDPEKVRQRDLALKAAETQSSQQLVGYRAPGLTGGFIARAQGPTSMGSGDVFVQGRVSVNGREGLFDDIVGRGFLILSRRGDPAAPLSDEQMTFWQGLGGRFVTFGAAVPHGRHIHFEDIEGWYGKLFDALNCDVVVKRSDYYLFGAYRSVDDIPGALTDMKSQLETARAA